MLLSCCWISACCCINGSAAAAGYCANFWARDSALSRAKSAGNPEGSAEENDGGPPPRLGVAMENMGVDRVWLSPGVGMGKLFREITGVDRGWLSCPDAPVIPCRLGCWCRKYRTKLTKGKEGMLSNLYEKSLAGFTKHSYFPSDLCQLSMTIPLIVYYHVYHNIISFHIQQ